MTPSGEVAVALLSVLVNCALGLILWGLKTALTDLKTDIKSLQDMLWKDTVRKAELARVEASVDILFGKYNSLALECAKQHGGE